jgi:UDP-2,3-diacylglucosamine pyrophosphatase LpxH
VGRKLKFVLSDLHLGTGHRESNYLEDFIVDKQLARFLQAIWQESERDQREVELIINGDLFEFLQVPAVENYDPTARYPSEAYLDSSESASIKRLNLIVEGHPEVFNALSDFMHVETPPRRITIIKGNHDVNLYWSGVKARLREVLGASGSRSSLLLFAEEFVSREKIYVEHGHQRTEKMNSYHDFLDPRRPDDLSQLYYPVGSRFAIDFGSRMGQERWFVDNIKPITTLIWYALHWDFDFAAGMLARFIRHTPALVVSDFGLNDMAILAYDDWLQKLEDPAARRELADRYMADLDFRRQFHQQIQQYLSDATAISRDPVLAPPAEVSSDPLAMGRADQIQQQAALHHAAEEIARQQGARVIVFGHTHFPTQEPLETGGFYINTGCWLCDLSSAPSGIWQGLFEGSQRYSDLRPRLPYARIDYDEENNPSAQLLYFAEQPAKPDPPLEAQPESKRRGFLGKSLTWFTRALLMVNTLAGTGNQRPIVNG